MANLTSNHDKIYFDNLCRTKKAESVLSLILATYQAKGSSDAPAKEKIAKNLKYAYELFKGDSGSYTGSISQFEKQYTIGHELCIWKNSNLDLTDLAIEVAENRITIRDYFDIVFLNYIQPVNSTIVHILYHLLIFMKANSLTQVTKEQMLKAYQLVCHVNDDCDMNGAYNMLIGTNYFKADASSKSLIFCAPCSIPELIDRCDITYVEKGYSVAKEELATEEKYIEYLLNDKRFKPEANNSNKNPLDKYLKASLSERKQIFITWLKKQEKPEGTPYGGKPYSDEVVQNYADSLALDASKLVDIVIENTNLFFYVDSLKFEQVKELIKAAPNFDDVNRRRINKGFTCALDKYANFLIKLNNKDIYIIRYSDFVEGGENMIYYGTPGCGKSYHVANTILAGVSSKNIFRTTFYQDYTHTDFVGQIMPKVTKTTNENGKNVEEVSYSFVPGPFVLALERAYLNPKEKIYLVIEEINRGSAASIFGDLFQLLDREKEGNPKGNPVGQSEYPIDKEDVSSFLKTEKNIYLPDDKVFIPSNLYIYATMNTNDQNVNTLDTAFKRRWKMEKIRNTFKADHPYSKKYIPGTSVDWQVFVTKINDRVVSDPTNVANSEDKQIGPFFLEAQDLSETKNDSNKQKMEAFAYKMLEYLWTNVARFDRDSWFNDSPKTLDQLVDNYTEKKLSIFAGALFDEDSEETIQSDTGDGEE